MTRAEVLLMRVLSAMGMLLLCLPAPVVARTIAVGLYPSYPPLDMRDMRTDALEGFDVDLSAALLQRMGMAGRVVETSFAQLIPSLETGRIQMFFNGMMDTPARRQSIAFVDYLQSGVQFLTLSDEPHRPLDPQDMCGRMVAASRITSEPAHLLHWSERICVARGLPPVVLFAAENSADARLQLMEGRVVATLQDSLTAPWIIARNHGRFRALGAPFDMAPLGIGLSKDDRDLTCRVQRALNGLQADGSYLRLIRKWGLPPESALPRTSGALSCPT
ncbi:ABC transporter substrate-binding protein [Nguyenibacter vanlangensis]|uniref:ABC transporter substrate-binding protein n=2 Tax=Nguyenibacter vanlangensis TaxID=1216886 RepID=A0A7Y7IX02_9PROT|nr:ABC transporter substrate-binding protein [Nguyenibacter vanlangensis]